jgi:quercetin dioxygenase-like cupin family protein
MIVIRNIEDVEAQPVPNLKGATIKWLISEPEGAPNFAMRVIELEPGASSPHHAHEWEHEMFILLGKGQIWKDGEKVPIKGGDAILVPPNEEHEVINNSQGPLRFMCLIPLTPAK